MNDQKPLSGKKILFISVSFFDFEIEILKKIKALGAEVDFFDDRPSNAAWQKALIRWNKSMMRKQITRYYENIWNRIVHKKYDYLFVLKGEAIPIFFLQRFKDFFPDTLSIYYAYDSIAEHPYALSLIPLFDKALTFDRIDAKKYGMKFRPTFYLDGIENKGATKIKTDAVFIGTANTDRYIVAKKLESIFNQFQWRSVFYFYTPNIFLFRLRKILDPHLKYFPVKSLTEKKLSYQEMITYYKNASIILDITKPYQNGLTMRVFEALVLEKKLITTNKDIVHYPFYHPNNICVIDRNTPVIDKKFLEVPYASIDPQILDQYTLLNWTLDIFINP